MTDAVRQTTPATPFLRAIRVGGMAAIIGGLAYGLTRMAWGLLAGW